MNICTSLQTRGRLSTGTYKVRNEIETKRNENETKRNETKRNQQKRTETKSTKTKRNRKWKKK